MVWMTCFRPIQNCLVRRRFWTRRLPTRRLPIHVHGSRPNRFVKQMGSVCNALWFFGEISVTQRLGPNTPNHSQGLPPLHVRPETLQCELICGRLCRFQNGSVNVWQNKMPEVPVCRVSWLSMSTLMDSCLLKDFAKMNPHVYQHRSTFALEDVVCVC